MPTAWPSQIPEAERVKTSCQSHSSTFSPQSLLEPKTFEQHPIESSGLCARLVRTSSMRPHTARQIPRAYHLTLCCQIPDRESRANTHPQPSWQQCVLLLIEEINTAPCLQKLSMSEGNFALPGNIRAGVFTNLTWDNIDRLEETTSGERTPRRVNGIAVQAKTAETGPGKVLPPVVKTKKRNIISSPLMLPTYNAGQREGPPRSKSADVDSRSNSVCQRENPSLGHGTYV